jgi:acetylornithine deacetylase/succinyl-diaminopimelate desuccinylase family protein
VDEVTLLLSDLVAIPSVNPMGRPMTGPGIFEGGMTEYLERWFRALGVPCVRQEVSAGRDNLLARYEAEGGGPTLLFDAHQDTVPTDGMTIPPFLPRIEGGRLYGRGSCDIKGGMAAMLVAFARLVRERPAGSASVIMACTVDEEFTHTGSSLLATTPTGADLAIVAEPTGLDLVNCHKGAVRWKVRTRGVACHSSTPHLGANAIYRMARVVSALADHANELSEVTPHPVLGPPSLSVGRIEGGQSVNVVPDWCEIEIDRRVIPGEDRAEACGQAHAHLLRRLGDEARDWIEFLPPWVNMPSLSPDGPASEWLARVRDALTPILGRRPEVTGVPYGTDAGPLGASGLPCLVFGPGDIAQAHTKDEWIELDQVRMAAEAYYRMARSLGKR